MRNSLFKYPLFSLQSPSSARVIKIKVNKNSGECIDRYPLALALASSLCSSACSSVYRLNVKQSDWSGISDQGLPAPFRLGALQSTLSIKDVHLWDSHNVSILARCPSYRQSAKGSKESQGPTLGVSFSEVSVL